MDAVGKEIFCKTEENVNNKSKELKCNVFKNELSDGTDPDNPVCIPPKKGKIFSNVCQKEHTNEETVPSNSQQHDEKSRFVCEICKRSLSTKRNLIEHYRCTHTDERPFICDICGKGFKQKRTLNTHFVSHARDISKYNFDETTKQNLSDLIQAKMFKCSLCEKGFGSKRLLEEHFLSHSEKKTLVCHICKSAFKSISGLRKHSRYHTRKKQYKCDLCDKKFIDIGDLRNHNSFNHDAEKGIINV